MEFAQFVNLIPVLTCVEREACAKVIMLSTMLTIARTIVAGLRRNVVGFAKFSTIMMMSIAIVIVNKLFVA